MTISKLCDVYGEAYNVIVRWFDKVNIRFLVLLMHWKHMRRAVDFDI